MRGDFAWRFGDAAAIAANRAGRSVKQPGPRAIQPDPGFAGWRPPEALPDLSRHAGPIFMNFETTGLDWRRDEPIAAAVSDGERSWYWPWAHRGGGNVPDGLRKFTEWAASSAGIRGRRIENPNMKFDAHFGRKIGVDLDALGCALSDPQIWAGLLDDSRKQFGVDVLLREILGETPMPRLDESRMAEYHAGQAAPRSEYGVMAVGRLRAAMLPRIEEEGLGRVLALEEEVIHAVVEMEENGAPIDLELLERYRSETLDEIERLRRDIARSIGGGLQESLFEGAATGGGLNPDSSKEMSGLFRRLRLEPPINPETGKPTFDASAMGEFDGHPVLGPVARLSKLLDLESKYWKPYSANHMGGVLQYNLHQMRVDRGGTRRGRFSATDVNIQQVLKPSKQAKTYGPGKVVRSLFVPGSGLFVSCDASQIEYRIFAHYAGNQRIIERYAADPWLDFHEEARAMISEVLVVDRDKAKTCNFLTIYGGGLAKLALQLGYITTRQFAQLAKDFPRETNPFGPPWDHPLLKEASKVRAAYRKALPEVRVLSDRAKSLAKERGFVRDCLGRRARFPGGLGAHAALNAVIQPSASEVMKTKMVEAHKARKAIGFTPRMTIHDDLLGDCDGEDSALALDALMNRQSLKFDVPILWETKIGPRWSETRKAGTNG